jgi:hypothetical protein
MKTQIILLSVCLFTLNLNGISQERVLSVSIAAGLNFSQLEGEGVTDYYGLNAGVVGSVKISKNFQISTELLFSQNGEYILPLYYPPADYGKIRLNYLEIPIHTDWLFSIFRKEAFQDFYLQSGFAYVRLINYYGEDIFENDLSERVVYDKRDGILTQIGICYFFTEDIGLNLRASLPVRLNGLGWTLSSRLIYEF